MTIVVGSRSLDGVVHSRVIPRTPPPHRASEVTRVTLVEGVLSGAEIVTSPPTTTSLPYPDGSRQQYHNRDTVCKLLSRTRAPRFGRLNPKPPNWRYSYIRSYCCSSAPLVSPFSLPRHCCRWSGIGCNLFRRCCRCRCATHYLCEV